MGKQKQKIYWDNCIFIAWIHDEPLDVSIMAGIEDVVKQVDNKEITLMTSVVTRTELLESKMNSAAKKKCDDLFNRRNVVMINLDRRISDLSHEIRSYYDRKGVILGTADCQHVATAILYEADEFHTLDGSGKKKKGTILQTLTGKIAGKYLLNILVPRSTPGPLFDEQKDEGETMKTKLIAPAKTTGQELISISALPAANQSLSINPQSGDQSDEIRLPPA